MAWRPSRSHQASSSWRSSGTSALSAFRSAFSSGLRGRAVSAAGIRGIVIEAALRSLAGMLKRRQPHALGRPAGEVSIRRKRLEGRTAAPWRSSDMPAKSASDRDRMQKARASCTDARGGPPGHLRHAQARLPISAFTRQTDCSAPPVGTIQPHRVEIGALADLHRAASAGLPAAKGVGSGSCAGDPLQQRRHVVDQDQIIARTVPLR